MHNLESGDLKIIADVFEDELRLVWHGKSGDRKPRDVLGPYFETARAFAEKRNTAITMHFEHLTNFNSSTITVLIQFIQQIRPQGIVLKIFYNAKYKWQCLSFDALRVFESPGGVVTFHAIEVVPPNGDQK